MTRWFALACTDDEFLRTAPIRFVHDVDVPAAPTRVWEVLASDDALVSWARGITGAEWTSPRPFGVGTTRTVTVGGRVAALRERFYRWDVGHRMTFTADASSAPGFRRFSEDVALAPTATGTRLTWTFAIEAAPWFAPLLTFARPLLHNITGGWARGVATHVSTVRANGATR
jgi:carbon monoxide dehydrogenase subunit G